MPTTDNVTTTYAGEKAGKYISAALLSAPTLEAQAIEIMPNVKFKSVIQRIDTDGILKDGTCDFDPTSTITRVEQILQPKELQVNLQLCKKNFRDTWDAIEMGYSAHDVIPKSFADYLIAYQIAKVAEANEVNIWRGVNATNGQFDGFATKLTTDASLPSANEVSGTTVTAANVITELGKIIDAMPAALYGKPDVTLYLPQNMVKAYVRALGGFGASGLGASGVSAMGTAWYNGQGLNFDGVPIFQANGLASNVAILSQKSNLFFGTGLLSDSNEVKLIDMADIDGSQNVRFVMRLTAGVQYGAVEDIVTYGITNSAN